MSPSEQDMYRRGCPNAHQVGQESKDERSAVCVRGARSDVVDLCKPKSGVRWLICELPKKRWRKSDPFHDFLAY